MASPRHHDRHFVFHRYVIDDLYVRCRPLPYQARIPAADLDVVRIVGLDALHRVFEGIDRIPPASDSAHASGNCMRDAASSSARPRGAGSRAVAASSREMAANPR